MECSFDLDATLTWIFQRKPDRLLEAQRIWPTHSTEKIMKKTTKLVCKEIQTKEWRKDPPAYCRNLYAAVCLSNPPGTDQEHLIYHMMQDILERRMCGTIPCHY